MYSYCDNNYILLYVCKQKQSTRKNYFLTSNDLNNANRPSGQKQNNKTITDIIR